MMLSGCHTPDIPPVEVAGNPDTSIQVLLLGTYHFANPGMDKHHLEVDDYLSEMRQKEIREVVDRLSPFKPTQVMVEQPSVRCRSIDSLYTGWREGRIRLNDIEGAANEIFQLGFSVAGKNNLHGVECIDEGGVWLGSYVDFVADTLGFASYLRREEASAKRVEEMNHRFAKQTVRENLIALNQWESILYNHDYYNRFAVMVRDTVGIYYKTRQMNQEIDGLNYIFRSFDFENIGVELVAEWYKRNLKIYRNILDRAKPGDRLLIIFGQGHIRYLHQMLEDHPDIEVVDALTYLEG